MKNNIMNLPAKQKRPVCEVTGWRYSLIWLGAKLLQTWCRTLRFTVPQGIVGINKIKDDPKPLLIFFWHNNLFTIVELHRRYGKNRRVGGLVSASKDGAYLAAFFRAMRIVAVRGSSSNRGAAAVRELCSALSSGMDIAITPDGPRGPRYEMKPGAAWLAKESNARLLFIRMESMNFWRLKSWDGFFIPKPFSEIRGHYAYYENVQDLTGETEPTMETVQECCKRAFNHVYSLSSQKL
jgi:lysophospholipid acyltransferase (LPLAT)-like uncharacterized protein